MGSTEKSRSKKKSKKRTSSQTSPESMSSAPGKRQQTMADQITNNGNNSPISHINKSINGFVNNPSYDMQNIQPTQGMHPLSMHTSGSYLADVLHLTDAPLSRRFDVSV
jgi:hypothetical protein